VPSAKRPIARLAALSLCGALAVGSLSACATTQEKAAAQRAEAAGILKARAKRRHNKADGPKTVPYGSKASRRRGEEG
jgi:hypothetical protein